MLSSKLPYSSASPTVAAYLYSSPIGRCGTHRAALRATIKRATLKLEAAHLLTGLADSFHFTVPSRVVFSDHAIGAFGEYVAVLVNDYGAENPARFLDQRSFGREFNRPLHEFLILLCHRISPLLGLTCLTADAKIRRSQSRRALSRARYRRDLSTYGCPREEIATSSLRHKKHRLDRPATLPPRA